MNGTHGLVGYETFGTHWTRPRPHAVECEPRRASVSWTKKRVFALLESKKTGRKTVDVAPVVMTQHQGRRHRREVTVELLPSIGTKLAEPVLRCLGMIAKDLRV